MSSAVAELDGYLQSMLALKPPGVSASKISIITSLCAANVQSESVLVQKIYTHFKRAPGTHKLGVLYVVDSVTRQWVESARKAGQTVGSGAPDGTFAAGVNRVTELLPVLMTDIINNAPEYQKDKIKKLVDIWERGYTFPAALLASLKEQLNAPVSQNVQSTTPDGSPAPNLISLAGGQHGAQASSAPVTTTTSTIAGSGQPAPPAPDTSSILKALADMAKNSTATPATSGVPAQTSPHSIFNPQNPVPQAMPASVDPAAQQPNGQAVNPFAAAAAAGNLANQFAGLSNMAQNPSIFPNQGQASAAASNPLAAVAAAAQQNPLAALMPQAGALPPETLQQLSLLQLMAAQGIPQDQWATALQILSLSNTASSGMVNMNPATALAAFAQQPAASQNTWSTPAPDSLSRDRDRDRDHRSSREHDREDYVRSPPGGYRRRSRSPGWDRRREVSPPRRRDSPVYGEYHGDSPGRNRDTRDSRGRRPGEYRQRSPPGRRRRSPTPPRKEATLPPPGPKFLEWDYSIGQGNIKVLSRTLFVGGVTSSESHLRSLFGRYGVVQTCIVNIDKRHAFVKMINRHDAVTAREGMEQYKSGDMQLRTRWGVGFGPRDCSDYQTGISVIPIDRLTDADRKWMLNAEYGGTGGKPIESFMVVEEPDIEIGAGVSSKAISRRMATDQGGKRGPQSTRTAPEPERFRRQNRGAMDDGHGPGPAHGPAHGHGYGHGQMSSSSAVPGSNGNGERNGSNMGDRNDRDGSASANNANAIGVPPAVPGFGFSFQGMPMFPPGFMMGGAGAGTGTGTSAQDQQGQQGQQGQATESSSTPLGPGQGQG
ncbi:RNA binding protein Nrd1 [Histoplasma capsulatum H143]|uniref:RNA binding protein Nrd1 n=1 Tax=Ajellomyces capsulatus (strain H143) TaxID=544712 RepID=C6HGG6_AJECH|nr:RNA binding protein Nrd1 [Histoplasma capsulatum H143]